MTARLIDDIKYQQSIHHWSATIQLCQQLQQDNPESWEAYWWAGQAYKNLMQYDDALAQFSILKQKFPNQYQGWEGEINVAEHQQNWQAVWEKTEVFQQQFPHLWHGLWWRARVYLQRAEYEQAIESLSDLMNDFPNNPMWLLGNIDLAYELNDWDLVAELSEIGLILFPNHFSFYQHQGLAWIQQHQFTKAENYFIKLKEKFPNDIQPFLILARIYQTLRQYTKAIDILQKSLEKFPKHQLLVSQYIRALITNNEPQVAHQVFKQHILSPHLADNQLLRAEIVRLEENALSFLKNIQSLYAQFPQHTGIAHQYAHVLTTLISLEPHTYPQLAIQVLEQNYQENKQNQHIAYHLIYQYIRLGEHKKAKNLIESLPTRQHVNHLRVLAWLAHYLGDLAQEKAYWKRILNKMFYLELQKPKAKDLINLNNNKKNKKLQLNHDDIPLITVVHNELLRLPDFLRHYRQLGVTHFLVVDNGSDDGSLEFLLKQKDCWVFLAKGSHNESASGMMWVNSLMKKYFLENQWCIHADVDELLIYPHCEQRPLPQLIDYLNQIGAELLSSFMLDMYPRNVAMQLAFQSGEQMVAQSPYFFHQYERAYQLECPYDSPMGGIFTHFRIPTLNLTKTSLVKNQADFYFLSATHRCTPCQVADISSVYLHFKMLGDFYQKAKRESERKEHASGGAMYRKYAQMYEQEINHETDLSQLNHSVEYQNSQQLVDLGLIRTSLAWDCFTSS